jgi:predicted membrane protein
MIQTVASNYLIGLSYFYDNLILSSRFWTGLLDILIGIMGLVLFVFIAKWIIRFGSKKVLSRMILFSLVGYILLAFVPASRGDALKIVRVLGLEIPAENSYWLATLMYFVIYVGFALFFFSKFPLDKKNEDWVVEEILSMHGGSVNA